ncbi:hypothetical protein GCM10027160_47770 [Streptomyces calidiresistens]
MQAEGKRLARVLDDLPVSLRSPAPEGTGGAWSFARRPGRDGQRKECSGAG